MTEAAALPIHEDDARIGQLIATSSSPSYGALDVRLDPHRTTMPGRFVATEAVDPVTRAGVLVISRTNDVQEVGSSRVDLQACKLEYSIVSPK